MKSSIQSNTEKLLQMVSQFLDTLQLINFWYKSLGTYIVKYINYLPEFCKS